MTQTQILVVEDDPDIAAVMAQVLEEDLDAHVETAANGKEALAFLEDHVPDAMLVNLRMPEMNGSDFLIARRELDGPAALVPAVVVSAAPDGAGIAADVGADGFLAKPFEIEALSAAVTRAL
ncbi:MAG: response regulator [Chloroflexi bacterium]|nr:response regulator [Chloroflexota bacterium]